MPALNKVGWVGDRWYDGIFFFGGAIFAVLLGALSLVRPDWILFIWWGWIVLLDGPHLLATFSRTLVTPEARAQWGRLSAFSLLLFLPGFIALILSEISGQAIFFELFLLATTVWSIHHNTRQHYGILSVYQWHNKTPNVYKKLDKWVLHLGMWGMFGVFLLGHPLNRQVMGFPDEFSQMSVLLAQIGTVILGCFFTVWIVSLVHRSRTGVGLKPGWFMLIAGLGSHAVMYGLIGMREPLFEAPKNAEQYFLVVALMMGVVHSLQYLGIVFASNTRRASSSRFWQWDRRPLLVYVVFVVVSLLYLGLNVARGTSPGLNFFGEATLGARLFLALYWGVFFHHFFVDQYIWKVSHDKSVRHDLGLISE